MRMGGLWELWELWGTCLIAMATLRGYNLPVVHCLHRMQLLASICTGVNWEDTS